jgi:bifunctional DNA-binding transcriptional regulator/antitoxin component of YhaV-PrlF toxin-antitoxin module
MEAKVRVREDGSVTLPASLLERSNIRPGETLSVVDVDGLLILTRTADEVSHLAWEIERDLRDAGVSMAEMFEGLRAERERYYQEKYQSGRS